MGARERANVAVIHVLLCRGYQRRGWPGQAWTSPAMTRRVCRSSESWYDKSERWLRPDCLARPSNLLAQAERQRLAMELLRLILHQRLFALCNRANRSLRRSHQTFGYEERAFACLCNRAVIYHCFNHEMDDQLEMTRPKTISRDDQPEHAFPYGLVAASVAIVTVWFLTFWWT